MTEHGHDFDPDSDESETIVDNALGESFIAYYGENGIYFDHNWTDGSLFVRYDTLREMLTKVGEGTE